LLLLASHQRLRGHYLRAFGETEALDNGMDVRSIKLPAASKIE